MRWIFNTDLFSMKGRYSDESSLKLPKKTMKEVASLTVGEGDLVIGDPCQFKLDDPYNDFDAGWDLEGETDLFIGMRK